MRHISLTMALALAVSALWASQPDNALRMRVRNVEGVTPVPNAVVSSKHNTSMLKEPEATCRITFEFPKDNPEYIPDKAAVIGADRVRTEFYMDMPGFDEIEVSVPSGTYDLVMIYKLASRYPADAYMVKENIEVLGDIIIDMTPRDIKHVAVKSILPDGSEALVPTIKWTDTGYEIVEPGNVENYLCTNYLYHKDFDIPISAPMISIDNTDSDSGTTASQCTDFYINDVSDNYQLIQSKTMLKDNDIFVVINRQDGSANDVMQNDPNSFCTYSEYIKPSPLGEINELGHNVGFSSHELVDGNYLTGWSGMNQYNYSSDGEINFHVSTPAIADNHNYSLAVLPILGDTHNVYVTEFENGYVEEDIVANRTTALRTMIDNNGHYHNYAGLGDAGYDGLEAHQDYSVVFNRYNPHPELSFSASQKLLDYGASAPLTFFGVKIYEGGYPQTKQMEFVPLSIGALGESRGTDVDAMDFIAEVNGETVASNYSDFTNYLADATANNTLSGKWKFSVSNTNVVVDGIEGESTAIIEYDYDNVENHNAPMALILQPRNDSNQITNKFNTAAEAELILVAGDYDYTYNPSLYRGWFNLSDVNVKAEVAPHNTDNWQEVTAVHDAEKDIWPGYGQYYTISLKDLKTKAYDGWFDVKLSMTDAAGNSNVQKISPVFRINELSGVEEIVDNGNDISIAGIYTLQGHRLGSIDVNALPNGIYVLKHSNGTSTKFIKR